MTSASSQVWVLWQRALSAGYIGHLILLVVIIAVLYALVSLFDRREIRMKVRRFKARECLSPDSFYGKFYADSGLDRRLVIEALETASAALRIPGGLLRPSDRFDVELAAQSATRFDDDVGFLGWAFDKIARERGVTVEYESIRTLDEYIRSYCNVLQIPKKRRRCRRDSGLMSGPC